MYHCFQDVKKFVNRKEENVCKNKMNRHIAQNFRYPEFAQKNGIQGRVFVQFIIEKDGNISGIRSRGPHGTLERAAESIIEKLPKMTPGYQRGLPVKVPFSIPITFRLQ
jgi:protein TonB